MRVSSSLEYAARLMTTLARARGGPLTAERLSELDRVPPAVAAQLLVKLRRASLVESRRGAAGGYVLSRPPERITLAELARAVDGVLFEDVCGRYERGRRDCRQQGGCSISPVWRRLGGLIGGYFEGVTLAAMLEEQPPARAASPAAYWESHDNLRAS